MSAVTRFVASSARASVRSTSLPRRAAPPESTEHPGDLQEDAGAREALNRAFDRLGAGDRIVLVLHHLDGRPVLEIAELLGIPEGTAKSRLHAARAALERALQREGR